MCPVFVYTNDLYEKLLMWILPQITQQVGRCRPVAGAVDSVEIIVCSHLVESLVRIRCCQLSNCSLIQSFSCYFFYLFIYFLTKALSKVCQTVLKLPLSI